MKNLRSKLRELEVKLIGNRPLVLGSALFTGSVTAFITKISYDGITNWATDSSFALSVLSGILTYVFYGEDGGTQTSKLYKKTTKHIKRFGHLGERFFKAAIDYDTSALVAGYCELQGMYLACRDAGKTEEFSALKKKYEIKNIIPNF